MAQKKIIIDEDGDTLEVVLNDQDEVQINLSYRDSFFAFECIDDVEEFINQLIKFITYD